MRKVPAGITAAVAIIMASAIARAVDTVVVFNEIMYHPAEQESRLEWLELHNLLAVNVDLTGWRIAGGIDYRFAEGAVIEAGGYLVVAVDPPSLKAATGLAHVLGPFTGRLDNAGETLQLISNSDRVMDEITYADSGDWPVAPDGSGASLAKRRPNTASAAPQNWTWSPLSGGTPGRENFPSRDTPPVRHKLIKALDTWRYTDAGIDLGAAWRQLDYNEDSNWRTGVSGFFLGAGSAPGERTAIDTLFSTGVDDEHKPLSPGQDDPHYINAATGEKTIVMQNHSAWLGNGVASQWTGLSGRGTDNFPAGQYIFRTTFDLTGYDPATAAITMLIAVDDVLDGVRLNGVDTGISCTGFSSFSGPFHIVDGFTVGINTLEFVFTNGGSSPNPSGLRVELSGTAVAVLEQTELAPARTYYFRKDFSWQPDPFSQVELKLDALIDDGAVFYLNGRELYRINMPDGDAAFQTDALMEIAQPAFTGPVTVPSTHLAAGLNVLAVEVHHAASSEDIRFAAALEAIETPLPPDSPVAVAINEITPADIPGMHIEFFNYGDTPVDMTGFVLACRGTTSGDYVFGSVTFEPSAFAVISESALGFHPSDEDKLFLYTPDGLIVDAAVVKKSLRVRFPDGTGRWARADVETLGQPNHVSLHDEIVINEIMYHYRPVREVEAEYETTLLVASKAPCAVRVPQDDSAGLAWTGGSEPFDDSAWQDGEGNTTGVGYEVSGSNFAGLFGTDVIAEMYNGRKSVYIRIPFTVDDPAEVETLILRMKYDDGFVAYLNGVEVAHANAPGRDGNPLPLTWQSGSTASHADTEAVVFQPTDVTAHKHLLRPGRNILAIHGLNWSAGSTDMLVLPELEARRILVPHVPFHESDQEWIELYNRSAAAVDLTGWSLDGGIRFDFPPGTTIPADGYLVVARHVDQFTQEYPGVPVTGGFEGALSNKGEAIILKDDNGNIADEVNYHDRGYWPQYADAGGSSLELRDCRADSAAAAAWAASDETQRSTWRTYTYRAAAVSSPGSNEPTLWNEFIVGLLDTGEVLLDDISVIEDPDGARIQVIQAGSFETQTDTWRCLGNHGLSRVITDPANPYNHVLHLVATGPTEHMHNHVETTFAAGRTIVTGREYEISFRARWLAGSDQLNTRLYFNRAARTTFLRTPPLSGTPGQRNSRYTPNLGPTISQLTHSPAVPAPGEPIEVSAYADDPDGIAAMVLYWSANEAAFQTTAMTAAGGGYYIATVPGLPAGTIVQFYVQSRDTRGAVAVWPPTGAASRALCRINDNQARPAPAHNFRIIMTPSDAAFLHEPTNVMSNHRMPATVIYNERDIYYDVGVHLKGSGYGRNNDRAGFNVRFRPDQLFQGVHDVVSVDRNGGPGGGGASHRELVLKHVGNRAGSMPGMYDDVVNLISPLGNLNGPAQLMMARYDDAFLDAQYENGAQGTLYEFELIYYSQNTVDGNPQSLKLPPNNVLAIDFTNMGDDKEAYRWNYLIKNNRAADDYSRVIDMAKTFSLGSSVFETAIEDVIDVDEWMRVFAFESLGGVGDTYNQGLAHNLMLYTRPADGRVLALPWDLDFAFFESTSASVFGWGSNLQKVIAIDRFKRLFYGHLYDIIDTAFNVDYLAPWVDHYGAVSGQNVGSEILSRVDQRRRFVLDQMPPHVPFAITTNASNPFTVDSDSVTLQGNGWINVRRIRLSGNDEPLQLRWTDLDSWSVTLPLEGGLNTLTLEAYDYQDRFIASDSITVTSTSSERPLRRYLRVTEIMYDPLVSKDYEFIELCNIGPDVLDVSQVTITGGITFSFADGVITSLQPGAYVLVVKDSTAFQSRYGADKPVAGQYSGSLGNEGDTIVIRGAFGADVLSFEYNDGRGWPPAADGPGHSLVPLTRAIADEPAGSLNYCGNWRASTYIHGSPGQADPELPPGLVLNEIMAHTDYPVPPHDSNDWIELLNTGDSPICLDENWYLSDDKDELAKWPLPRTTVPAGGRITFDEVTGFHNPITTGFGLDKAGEEIFLSHLPATGPQRVVDCLSFKGQEADVSLGRSGDGGPFWVHQVPTRNLPNGAAVKDLLISEIMIRADRQYVELYNPTANLIVLYNEAGAWRLDGETSYVFPPTASIPPHGRLVVVDFDPVAQPDALAEFETLYNTDGLVANVSVFGPFSDRIPQTTGRIAIERPQLPDKPGDPICWVIVDEAIYFNGPPWPTTSLNPLSALQRQPFDLAGNDPRAWRSAAPTPGGRSPAPADFDHDGDVDMADAAILAAAWHSEPSDPAWNAACDISLPPDGLITEADLQTFAAFWLYPWQNNP